MAPEHPRQVRSFVKRTGRMTKSQSRALDELWPAFGVDVADAELSFETLFGRDAPVVLEIGFGNGETLVEQAANDPDRNYLGVEVHDPGIGHCLLLIQERRIDNVRLIAHDAVDVLQRQIPGSSLARINLYFPDPWPKKRHHKRRLLQPEFLELAADKLAGGGELFIATDWANYAEHIDEVIAADERFTLIERSAHAGDRPIDRPTTKFERRGLGKGHAIWDWRLQKR